MSSCTYQLIAIGESATENIRVLDIEIGQNTLFEVFHSVCLANMLASSHTPRLKAQARCEIGSVRTRRGTIPTGVPDGTQNEKK